MTQEEYEQSRRALEQELQADLALIHAAHEARARALDRLRRLAVEESETGAASTAAQVDRLLYILANGCKEGLVARPQDWPGAHCVNAL